ncbi:probable C-terminal domain small phosphatase [Selaginella moellendorffii]|nr:probable C-terminal domain small phosphatase [Selaginella moellendorffii]|eukprot:XP_002979786.2 probable C-terminal domain small phosphatase [Selaginella moellendorffii]
MKREHGDWDFQTLDLMPEPKKVKTKGEFTTCILPPPLDPNKPTLVLDMDNTLIHAREGKATLRLFSGKVVPLERYMVAKRPGVDEFLRDMAKLYEIVVFTAAMQYYADKILDKLDPEGLITHRLYRDSCVSCDGGETMIKDLSRLGRDLKRVVIVDDNPHSFSLQPRNGIPIPAFKNRKGRKYSHLKDIGFFLETFAKAEDLTRALDIAKTKRYRKICKIF